MPLFSRHAEPAQQQAPAYEEPPKRHGLFGGRQEPARQPEPMYNEQPKKHGLFGSRHEPARQPEPMYDEQPKRGLFGSRRQSLSPTGTNTTRSSSAGQPLSPDRGRNGGGVFRRSTDASNTSSQRGGLLHRGFGKGNNPEMDPSIVQAREQVMHAEMSEREADRALMAARESVRGAREEVRRLEIETQEEARRAKIKQHHAKEVSKRGKQLGRFGL